MKLLRFGERGAEKPGVVDEAGVVRDASSLVPDYAPDSLGAAIDALKVASIASLPEVSSDVRLGPPIHRTGHFIGIGLNYADHAAESGMPIPTEPIIFSKAPSSLSGPNDDIALPRGSEKTDWEVELAFIIGRRCHYVDEADALAHVAGFVLCNDVSERAYQTERGGQWIKGKSAPGFGPLGPWMVTPDEIADCQNLDMFLDVNGERRQTGNTRTMIFPVAHLIAYLSQFMALEPGDIVTTGTPPGVGMGMKPPLFLKAGDTVRLGIAGLGEQNQRVVSG